MCLFVHARGTTGQDRAARRRHDYAAKCAQCGVALTDTTRVAAHVVAYPLANGCCGYMTLRTTCKACNASRGGRRRARWWGCAPRARRLRCLCTPMCAAHDATRDDGDGS